jgi:hypothetical protein
LRTHHLAALAGAVLLIFGATQAEADPRGDCGRVLAARPWQSTGIRITVGEAVCIEASGVWSHGAEAGGITPFHGPAGYIGKPDEPAIVPWPFARIGALLARIGEDGIAFPVEDGLCFTAQAAGELMLSMNDLPDGFEDNAGTLRVAFGTGRRRNIERLAQDTRLLLHRHCLR